MDLLTGIERFLKKNRLTERTGIVAISGGPDSVALAHALALLVKKRVLPRLVLAHLNHQLRGDESDADEAFVRTLPDRWKIDGITARSETMAVQASADMRRANLEAEGRQIRYGWLAQVATQENAAWIATGHTANDQAETVLFRILRGTGIAGLTGIAPVRAMAEGPLIVRPMLEMSRTDVMAYLHRIDQDFRVDSSNADLRFLRNRIRHELLPRLEHEYNPQLASVLTNLAEQARDWTVEIEATGKALLEATELPPAGAIRVFRLDRLTNVTDVCVVEMFRQVWQREGWPMGEMGHAEWRRLVGIVREESLATELPSRVDARRVGRVLQLKRTSGEPEKLRKE